MAQGNKEHRMVFDIRGRRRHVVKFVYALLAILMAGSLFLVTGAINLNSIFGTASSGESAAQVAEKQAVAIEQRIKKEPAQEEVLLSNLTRARISVANSMISEGLTTEEELEEVRTQLSKASEDWSKYLETAKEPSPGTAALVAPAMFQLAQVSTSGDQSLLYIGDTMHHSVISVQQPDWTIAFDGDAPTAQASRKAVLESSAAGSQRIYAVHFPFPGIGKFEKQGDKFFWVAE